MSTTVDPFAIPSKIDAAYIERVLAAIDQVRADVRNHVVATKTYSPEDDAKLKAIYGREQYEFASQEFKNDAIVGVPSIRPGSGAALITVVAVRSARSDCVEVEAILDERPNQITPREPADAIVTLRTETHDTTVNPTPWELQRRVFKPQAGRDECA